MKGKIFTIPDANLTIPLISRIADDIVTTYDKVRTTLREFETLKKADEDDQAIEKADREVARHLDRFQELIEEIEALGARCYDYERGSICFYSDFNGEIVYLCWERGDDTISQWRKLDGGSRQSLELTQH